MRHSSISILAFLVLIAPRLASQTHAADVDDHEPRQLVQELFSGETVFQQERGELQVTLAPDFTRWDDADAFASRLKLEYGLTNRLQVEAEAEPLVVHSANGARSSGVGEVELGLSWGVLDIGGSGLHLSLGGGLGVRSGALEVADADSGERREWEAGVVLGRDFGPLQTTAGLSAVGAAEIGADVGTAMRVHGAVVVPYRQLRMSGEVLWLRLASENATYLTPGVTACLARNFEVGFGVAVGVGNAADPVRLAWRVTYEFGGADRD